MARRECKYKEESQPIWACSKWPGLTGWLPFIGYTQHCFQCLWTCWPGTTSPVTPTCTPKLRTASGISASSQSPTNQPAGRELDVTWCANGHYNPSLASLPWSWLYCCVPLSLGPAFHQIQGLPSSWRYLTNFSPHFSHCFPSRTVTE